MGKITLLGLVPADDPMFGRVEFFYKISTQPKSQKLKHAKRITVVWEGQDVHLDLTTERWEPIQSGKKLIIEELDENGELTYRWLFNAESEYSLIVDFGDPNHMRWLGQLADAQITDMKD